MHVLTLRILKFVTMFTKYNLLYMYILQANTLHWTCIQKFPNIYHSNLWPDMKIVLDVIKDGMQVRIVPVKLYS